ncbi:Serine/threonine-protein kinase BRI1-like 1 [Morella rubra]|uniref:Serine/threonine-protein kinase BRI1-like 1 n=1 Tax=Morella rubra TaxID=262757 RepID=A0A6A1UZH8_9ROSI|nr:Serine/threonine-protein kinase BRI1-like 1 [Morella rubra]
MGFLKFPLCSLVLLIVVLGLSAVAESKTYWGDIEVLKAMKNGLDVASVRPGSCVSSWDFKVDPCDNLFGERFTCGFRCDVVVSGRNRVTEISLDQAGYIDTHLDWLTLCAEELYLDNNNLQGIIPASWSNLVNLKRLELQSNKLSGEFPNLGSLRNLYYLDASDNAISGKLPRTFPSSLIQISMRNNNLEGRMVPDSFTNSTYLQVLDLSHNRLSGSVPALLFDGAPSLQQLVLSFNQFTSVQVPACLGTQSELIAVDLSNNELQGFLPAFMALMPRLSALSLENNKLTGMIPIQYALKTVVTGSGISPFARLLLGGNYLFGSIPDPLMGLKPGSVNVRLVDNCLIRCPVIFFFCQGGDQKSSSECRSFNPAIP